jgi:hypothetical protein
MDRRQPPSYQAVHPDPVKAVTLAPTPKRLEPVPGHLGPECSYCVGFARHSEVSNVASDYACQPTPFEPPWKSGLCRLQDYADFACWGEYLT